MENSRRQVKDAFYSFVTPKKTSDPKLLHVSDEMLREIGFPKGAENTKEFLNVFSGNEVLSNSNPYAMCYGGHQFGNWAGQLGDGRAINLGEVVHENKRWTLQLKGAGETPYSRSADGLAVLRSSIREYLCSEAMYHLGIPTTRALSLALTGDEVLRDVMYNGNPAYEKGAVVCRVAPSFIRFGNFEIFAARGDHDNLKKLADYTIKYFYKHLGVPSKETYIKFFQEVATKTLETIIHWQRVGFVHGVLNTDNMSILGLTIDYGPYGWLEGFDFSWTPNTTDASNRRYRFGNQPNVGLWNLYQLANALYPLTNEAEPLERILENYKTEFEKQSLNMMRGKLGLAEKIEGDEALILKLEENLELSETDMTIFFRNLSKFTMENPEKGLSLVNQAFYEPETITGKIEEKWSSWIYDYAERLRAEELTNSERSKRMNTVNPKYVLRNYMAQMVIDEADKGNYSLINELYMLLKQPYDEQPNFEKWYAKRPEWARHKVGCSMLSCSS
ncbi:YdiU family protein [Galbibacter sp. BG1]|uniref:protein adenylyltransferase SelO n=1 Tax=Galbibacter sp. BG1 TaxID=1170699 RepID=UPI0015B9552B|nr:YdiU family protein [Galbibacter sp. BG1]QLE03093.1 YdiU family protein [Galbibacter sp. BG1]